MSAIIDEAYRFCKSQLWRRFFPPQIDIDDLAQEYRLAELEGESGASKVFGMLAWMCHEWESTTTAIAIIGSHEHDPWMTDEEVEQYREVEREIHIERVREQARPILDVLDSKIPANRVSIFCRYYGIYGEPETALAIADSLGIARYQVNDIITEVVRVIRGTMALKRTSYPLYGTFDEVAEKRVRAWRKVKKKKLTPSKSLWV